MVTRLGLAPSDEELDGGAARPGVATPVVGRYNRGLVLETIRLHPDASRVEVAAATGLTTAAVSNIVRELIDDRLVVEGGSAESRGGKPRVRLRVRKGYRYAAGVHLRPHSVRVALADLDGTLVSAIIEPFSARESSPAGVLSRAAALVKRIQADAGIADISLLGVGVACPGPIDSAHRRIVRAPNLPRWHNVPVADALEEQLQRRVTVENNANAAAIGDKWLGVARDLSSFLYIYLGVGVGGAIFLDHHLYRGATGNAGAVGHLTVDPDGAPCPCGKRGCLETVSSEAAIAARVKQLAPGAKARLGLRFAPTSLDVDHERILKAVAAGEADVSAAVAPALHQLGMAIASLVNVLDVDHIVLGGPAVAAAPGPYVDSIRQCLSTMPIARSVQRVRVLSSELGAQAAVVGAASLIFHDTYAPRLLNA